MARSVHSAVLRRIQKVGFLTDIEVTAPPNRPELTVDWSPHTLAFQWGKGTCFMLELCLTTDRQTRIVRFGEMEIGGQEMHVNWWQNHPGDMYRLGGSQGHIYPWDAVLNHRVDERGIVQPGTPVEGILLGTCGEPFPPSCRHSREPAKLFIEDGFGTIHTAEISVRFDETLNIEVPKPRRRSSLFEPWETIPDSWQAAIEDGSKSNSPGPTETAIENAGAPNNAKAKADPGAGDEQIG